MITWPAVLLLKGLSIFLTQLDTVWSLTNVYWLGTNSAWTTDVIYVAVLCLRICAGQLTLDGVCGHRPWERRLVFGFAVTLFIYLETGPWTLYSRGKPSTPDLLVSTPHVEITVCTLHAQLVLLLFMSFPKFPTHIYLILRMRGKHQDGQWSEHLKCGPSSLYVFFSFPIAHI